MIVAIDLLTPAANPLPALGIFAAPCALSRITCPKVRAHASDTLRWMELRSYADLLNAELAAKGHELTTGKHDDRIHLLGRLRDEIADLERLDHTHN